MPHFGEIKIPAATGGSTATNDASLTIGQRVFQTHFAAPTATAAGPSLAVDDASLTLAQRAMTRQPGGSVTNIVSSISLEDVSLNLALRAYAVHPAPPVVSTVAVSATDILSTQIFGS